MRLFNMHTHLRADPAQLSAAQSALLAAPQLPSFARRNPSFEGCCSASLVMDTSPLLIGSYARAIHSASRSGQPQDVYVRRHVLLRLTEAQARRARCIITRRIKQRPQSPNAEGKPYVPASFRFAGAGRSRVARGMRRRCTAARAFLLHRASAQQANSFARTPWAARASPPRPCVMGGAAKRKASDAAPAAGEGALAEAVEAAKRKAEARLQSVWREDTLVRSLAPPCASLP